MSGAAGSGVSAFASPVLSLVFIGREQDELARQLEDSVSDQERKELHREQERLLLKMERKGEQIHKLHKHRKQVEAPSQHVSLTVTQYWILRFVFLFLFFFLFVFVSPS